MAQSIQGMASALKTVGTWCFRTLASITAATFLADRLHAESTPDDCGFALSDEGIGHVGDNDSVPLDKDGGFKQDG